MRGIHQRTKGWLMSRKQRLLRESLHARDRCRFRINTAASAGSTPKKKKKRLLVRGVKIPITSEAAPSVPASGAKSKEKEAGILLATKDTFLPNAVPLDRMKGKKPIPFKKVKVVKKGVSSPMPAEPVSSLQPDLQRRSSSPSLAERRPSEGMASHLIQVGNTGFELERQANNLDFENQRLLAQVPSEEEASLEEELAKLKEDLAKTELQNAFLAVIEEFKESKEFDAALSADVERFPEFLDALGANSAYGAFSFVKKYKEKYPELRSDYVKFQEDYKGSWFADLDLDASSNVEKDEEDAPPTGDAPPSASLFCL
ncbi:hypothetical protein LIER_14984 [Lithospermum erythrorhizon]|uniref:Uncharacterized protein n=1 Tax=Lithospermum erythrorhizon TaxID=34254 RepID=A0AAV3Q6E0_LITER